MNPNRVGRGSRAVFVALFLAAGYALSPASEPWSDRSPHKEEFVTVNGVKLHYLDWGGAGDAIVLLSGLTRTPHLYDDFAPKFTDRYRVLGLTRRGHGQSDKPDTGYDTANLVEDIRQFLDAMKIDRVILVGHSFGGSELTMFAGKYPQRTLKLIYLDAGFDKDTPAKPTDGELSRVQEPMPRQDNGSFDATRTWMRKFYRTMSDAIEADMRIIRVRSESGAMGWVVPRHVFTAIFPGYAEPDYSKVKAPVLSFYADDLWPELISGENQEKARPILAKMTEWRKTEREHFRQGIPGARIIIMPDTSHYCWIQREAEVVREMRGFLAEK